MAIFSAVSTDSEPELVKNTRFMPAGAISATFCASSKAFGCAIWNGGQKSISAAWRWIASVIFVRPWPALTHHRPAMPSSTWRPSSVQKCMPFAFVNRRGAFLNWRLDVKGIQ